MNTNQHNNDGNEDKSEDGIEKKKKCSICNENGHYAKSCTKNKKNVGLRNLGNTCFMNAPLQCLCRSEALKEYFLQDYFELGINIDNPIGTGGEIATSFSDLVNEMFNGKNEYFVPREFVRRFKKNYPQLSESPYSQQDSAEFIRVFLECIHEDVNRILKKPCTEVVEGYGRENDKVAKESWNNHKRRNDSVVVDNFQGQIRSEFQCLKCKNISVTFNAFSMLSVPVDSVIPRTINVSYVSLDFNLRKYEIVVSSDDTCSRIREEIVKITNGNPNKLVLCEVFGGKIFKFFGNESKVKKIDCRDKIFVYEISEEIDENLINSEFLPFTEIKLVVLVGSRYTSSLIFEKDFEFPLLFHLKGKITHKEIYLKCLNFLKKYIINEEILLKSGIDLTKVETCISSKEKLLLFRLERVDTFENRYYLGERDFLDYSSEVLKFVSVGLFSTFEKKNLNHLRLKMDVNSELIDFEKMAKFSIDNKPTDIKVISINNCLKQFCKKEQLGKNDSWYCKFCKEHVPATKKFDLWKLPKYLIIHIDRFSSKPVEENKREKNEYFIDFPFKLNMEDHTININNKFKSFNLYAVGNHYGGLGGGHFTAFAKVKDDWFEFDDSSVNKIKNENSIVSKSGYLLFYKSYTKIDNEEKESRTCSNLECSLCGINSKDIYELKRKTLVINKIIQKKDETLKRYAIVLKTKEKDIQNRKKKMELQDEKELKLLEKIKIMEKENQLQKENIKKFEGLETLLVRFEKKKINLATVMQPNVTKNTISLENKQTEIIKTIKYFQNELEEVENECRECRKNDKICVVCMDKPKNVCFNPCGHIVACQECSKKLENCLLCRKSITKRIRVFF